MSKLPSTWATCDAEWGEKRKHLYCPNRDSLTFYPTEAEARASAAHEISNGHKMVLVMEIKSCLVAKPIEFDDVAA
ncbi:MAG TPA: hypothetical protein VGH13_11510 [Xanthobacteraceae bacterium]|jgi:hypothetical protein